ncbi:MAG TPA: hypothetical protein VIJ51_13705 [Solirubrobacteraceae bacterium]
MRVRAVVAGALAVVVAGLVITLSHRAPRDAGSDHIVPAMFSATLPKGGELCQANPYLPPEAATAQILVGTYGRPVPALGLRFLDPTGAVVSSGRLPAGAPEGTVSIPISRATDPGRAAKLCLTVAGHSKVVVGGLGIPLDPTAEFVNGTQQNGRISVVYYRAGEESWWSLLGVLDQRFGLGKAGFFGDWTLPACFVLLLACWALVVRLLIGAGDETPPGAGGRGGTGGRGGAGQP